MVPQNLFAFSNHRTSNCSLLIRIKQGNRVAILQHLIQTSSQKQLHRPLLAYSFLCLLYSQPQWALILSRLLFEAQIEFEALGLQRHLQAAKRHQPY